MLPPKTIAVDCISTSSQQYPKETAVVVIDVIRSTTVITTALKVGQRCFFAPTVEEAIILAEHLNKPLLVGEVGGNMPYGFDLKNSPVDIEKYPDKHRPIVIVSTSGIPLLYSLRNSSSVYVACLRNCDATIEFLKKHYENVKLFGAPTRGEFREEDKLCCSWIAAGLMNAGYTCEDRKTLQLVNNWKDKPVQVCASGNSAKYLIETKQKKDLTFIIKHVNDYNCALTISCDEVVKVPA